MCKIRNVEVSVVNDDMIKDTPMYNIKISMLKFHFLTLKIHWLSSRN